jgi:3-hydroxyisobutyrate dehydrogenase
MRIAIVGMGKMGVAIACRLVGQGHDVRVWNRTPGKAIAALEAGATESDSVAEAVKSVDVLTSVLRDDEAVRSMVLEDQDVRAALRNGLAYVDFSTISPRLAAKIGASTEIYAAAPVMAGPTEILNGEATYFIGASRATLEYLLPLTSSLSHSIVTLPDPQSALVAKLAGNHLVYTGLMTLSEALAIARAGGLSDVQIHEVLSANRFLAPGMGRRLEAALAGQPNPLDVGLAAKDLKLAVTATDVHLPLAQAAFDVYQSANEESSQEVELA